MKKGITDITLSNFAKIAGSGYLVIIVTGIFAEFFVRSNLIIPGNAEVTVNNIMTSEWLFRTGILSFIIMVIFDVIVAWALYVLLKPINKNLSLLAAWLRLVNSTIFGIALFNLFSVLQIINSNLYTEAFGKIQLHSQVMLFINAFDNTWLIALIFFGLHLLILGYLIFKSEYIPKILGILLIVASFGYLIDSFANFFLPNYSNYKDIFLIIVAVPGFIGELSFCLWLLLKGKKIPEFKLVV